MRNMEKYRELKVEEYKEAITHLSSEELIFLKMLYSFPEHTAPAKKIAEALGYPNYQKANNIVVEIGKTMSECSGVDHPDYKKDICPSGSYEGPAYFIFIGPYFKCEGKKRSLKNGWEMKDNLCEALRIMGHVNK